MHIRPFTSCLCAAINNVFPTSFGTSLELLTTPEPISSEQEHASVMHQESARKLPDPNYLHQGCSVVQAGKRLTQGNMCRPRSDTFADRPSKLISPSFLDGMSPYVFAHILNILVIHTGGYKPWAWPDTKTCLCLRKLARKQAVKLALYELRTHAIRQMIGAWESIPFLAKANGVTGGTKLSALQRFVDLQWRRICGVDTIYSAKAYIQRSNNNSTDN